VRYLFVGLESSQVIVDATLDEYGPPGVTERRVTALEVIHLDRVGGTLSSEPYLCASVEGGGRFCF
jgi:hypothetical protein